MTDTLRHFASDNYAPVHPDILAAIVAANDGGSAGAYGGDPWTEELDSRIQEVFGPGTRAFPVVNGTGANVISLMAVTPRWGGVVMSDVAHANTDENGAPERVGSLKLLTRPVTHGKLTEADIHSWAGQIGDCHRGQPHAVSLTQSTELGTTYTAREVADLAAAARMYDAAVHMDGSRIANAAAFLGTDLRSLTAEVGVDILSFGVAKNGGMIGEAVVVLSPDNAVTEHSAEVRRQAAEALPYLRKSTMQLASKMRFVSAQVLAMLSETGEHGTPLWLVNAAHSNAMAQRLAAGIAGLGTDEVRVAHPVEANAVFATLPAVVADRVRSTVKFYDWGQGEAEGRVEARWMCSWMTAEAEVDDFVSAIDAAL
ncbi:MAG: threonine aldolase [Cellulomonadaceae bacterium]|nr:threonine aldolase [Cellulomonadaceae bacterium]